MSTTTSLVCSVNQLVTDYRYLSISKQRSFKNSNSISMYHNAISSAYRGRLGFVLFHRRPGANQSEGFPKHLRYLALPNPSQQAVRGLSPSDFRERPSLSLSESQYPKGKLYCQATHTRLSISDDKAAPRYRRWGVHICSHRTLCGCRSGKKRQT